MTLEEAVADCMANERWIFSVVGEDLANELLQETYLACVDTFSRTHPGEPFG